MFTMEVPVQVTRRRVSPLLAGLSALCAASIALAGFQTYHVSQLVADRNEWEDRAGELQAENTHKANEVKECSYFVSRALGDMANARSGSIDEKVAIDMLVDFVAATKLLANGRAETCQGAAKSLHH